MNIFVAPIGPTVMNMVVVMIKSLDIKFRLCYKQSSTTQEDKMNSISFSRENVINKNLICINIPVSSSKEIDFRIPLTVKSNITNKIVMFKFDAAKTSEEYELHEGWDGEENHVYYSDTENKNIVVDIWFSHNLDY